MGLPALISKIEDDNDIKNVIKRYDHNFVSLDKNFEKKPSPYILIADLSGIVDFSIIYRRNKKMNSNLKGVILKEEEQDGVEISKFLETLKIDTKLVIGIDDAETLNRIIYAWKIGGQNELIASVALLGKFISINACNFERFIFPAGKIPALKNATPEELKDFEIAKRGNYIHWPQIDVHLDLEAIKVALDPKLKLKIQNERMKDDVKFGEAIRDLRIEHGLRQSDFDLSDKQIRRFETGEQRPTIKAYEAMAKAHHMSLDEYMNELAEKYLHLQN